MAKIRDRIIKEAKRLFMENGYDQVSLRGIAQEAGTTIGNLTYHFPQKEDLIVEIQKDMQAFIMKELRSVMANGGYQLEGLVHILVMAQKSQDSAAFYFRNMIELSNDFKHISQNMIAFRKQLFGYLSTCFETLQGEGLMRPDIKARQYETLAYIIVMMATFWTQNHSPYYDPELPRIGLVQAASDVIYPYLTEKGLNDFEKVQLKYMKFDFPS